MEFEWTQTIPLDASPAHKVQEFHDVYELPVLPTAGLPSEERRKLRRKIISEEWLEYNEAEHDNDIVEIADALGDLVYVCYGAALEYGIDLDAVIAEIHTSNMSKLGEDGRPIKREDGKVIKGPNFKKPNLARVLFGEDTKL